MSNHIFILGAGAWGTALALSFARANNRVTLWARDEEAASAIQSTRENKRYLPGMTLPENITITHALDALADAAICLVVTPAQTTRAVLQEISAQLNPVTPVILCGKGLELNSALRQSEILQDIMPQQPFGVLSGPSFASDVANGLPTAVVLAASQMHDAERYASLLAAPAFRPYAQDDVLGVELAGALKNVLAIGAGIVAGAQLGENARAALITRGLAEITRLGMACGAKMTTFAGLAGLGDTVLTCGSTQSRNFSHGFAIGAGQPVDTSKTVEGLPTIRAALVLAEKHQVDMPVARALYHLVYESAPLSAVLDELMARPLKAE